MKYKEAMKTPDKPHWIKGVNDEHERFKKHKVFKAVPRTQNIDVHVGHEKEGQWNLSS
jgi:hypothetical protein